MVHNYLGQPCTMMYGNYGGGCTDGLRDIDANGITDRFWQKCCQKCQKKSRSAIFAGLHDGAQIQQALHDKGEQYVNKLGFSGAQLILIKGSAMFHTATKLTPSNWIKLN